MEFKEEVMQDYIVWLGNNWTLVIAVFWVLEKVVKISPMKQDDIVVDMLYGFIKKLVGKA